jgi:hypothetical protein
MAQSEYQLTLPARTDTDDDPAVAGVWARSRPSSG